MGRWIDALQWVQRWQTSGLTQTEFVRVHQLKRTTFSSWLRRSRLESADASSAAITEQQIAPKPSASSIVPAQWPAPVAAQLQLNFPSGVTLTLPAATDPAWVAALLRGLA